MNKTICFTGARPEQLKGYTYYSTGDITKQLERYLYIQSYMNNYKNFITGGNQGFDMLAFKAIHSHKGYYPECNWKNILVLPFHGQDATWMENGPYGRKEYEKMLANADEIIYVHDGCCGKNQAARLMMEQSNEMLNRSELCIGLWTEDDEWKNPNTAGTVANTLRKAVAKGLDVSIMRYRTQGYEIKITGIDEYWKDKDTTY